MDRKTARKYLRSGKLPSEIKTERSGRTRPDPFEGDWAQIAERLTAASQLKAKALFEDLLARRETCHPGQLRTFQRRVREWGAAVSGRFRALRRAVRAGRLAP